MDAFIGLKLDILIFMDNLITSFFVLILFILYTLISFIDLIFEILMRKISFKVLHPLKILYIIHIQSGHFFIFPENIFEVLE